MSIEVREAVADCWFVECDVCGYYQGPFIARDDALVDGTEHDCTPDKFGGDEPFTPTMEAVVAHLKSLVCSLTEPWAGPEYHDDHGHTDCLFVGWAIKYLTDGV